MDTGILKLEHFADRPSVFTGELAGLVPVCMQAVAGTQGTAATEHTDQSDDERLAHVIPFRMATEFDGTLERVENGFR